MTWVALGGAWWRSVVGGAWLWVALGCGWRSVVAGLGWLVVLWLCFGTHQCACVAQGGSRDVRVARVMCATALACSHVFRTPCTCCSMYNRPDPAILHPHVSCTQVSKHLAKTEELSSQFAVRVTRPNMFTAALAN
jgi:hypothetical protein